MASTPVTVENNLGQPRESEGDGNSRFIRVIVADTQAIFRVGLRKIFALEDDIRVVGQAESLDQTVASIQKFSADIVIFEAGVSPHPTDARFRLFPPRTSRPLGVLLQGTF